MKPMLACTLNSLDDIDYTKEWFIQPKIDGIRAIVTPEGLISRSGKIIRNDYIRDCLSKYPIGLDGELVAIGARGKILDFNETSSMVMSKDRITNFAYIVFDKINQYTFKDRFYNNHFNSEIELAETYPISTKRELELYTEDFLVEGYEGIILRRGDSYYKEGRSTLSKGELLKYKQFEDSEAIILDMFGMENHSFCMGSLLVEDLYTKTKFSVGSGFSLALRKEIWLNKDNHIGKIIKYKKFKIGEVDKPRFPIFLGFRDKEDM